MLLKHLCSETELFLRASGWQRGRDIAYILKEQALKDKDKAFKPRVKAIGQLWKEEDFLCPIK